MRIPRIYDEQSILTIGAEFSLGEDGSGHVGRVLRLKSGDTIQVFNGSAREATCEITAVTKKEVTVRIISIQENNRESPLHLHLAQVISRGEKMDFTLQKSVELGVSEITPLISQRCCVRLDEDRLNKKMNSWQKIIISACEQCGRSVIPVLNNPLTLEDFINQDCPDLKINLHPRGKLGIPDLPVSPRQKIRLIIGPEGGLSPDEIEFASRNGYQEVLLGPRILRTETAALTAISIIQSCFGDLS